MSEEIIAFNEIRKILESKDNKTEKQKALDRLDEIAWECKEDNWDGMGAIAVSSEYNRPKKFKVEEIHRPDKEYDL